MHSLPRQSVNHYFANQIRDESPTGSAEQSGAAPFERTAPSDKATPPVTSLLPVLLSANSI